MSLVVAFSVDGAIDVSRTYIPNPETSEETWGGSQWEDNKGMKAVCLFSSDRSSL
jgi:hypothetical protein